MEELILINNGRINIHNEELILSELFFFIYFFFYVLFYVLGSSDQFLLQQ